MSENRSRNGADIETNQTKAGLKTETETGAFQEANFRAWKVRYDWLDEYTFVYGMYGELLNEGDSSWLLLSHFIIDRSKKLTRSLLILLWVSVQSFFSNKFESVCPSVCLFVSESG